MKKILILAMSFFFLAFQPVKNGITKNEATSTLSEAGAEALKVLETKCNFCHKKRRKKRVFKAGNIEKFAPQIYKQVFVKKRMPKGGKKNRLTESEIQILKIWLEETKNYKPKK